MVLGDVRQCLDRNPDTGNEDKKRNEVLEIAVPRVSDIREHPLKKKHRAGTHYSTPPKNAGGTIAASLDFVNFAAIISIPFKLLPKSAIIL
jgi:hypothetical protein